ncbi:MAG: serine/threonine-protein kinase [Myxococcota bacterium]
MSAGDPAADPFEPTLRCGCGATYAVTVLPRIRYRCGACHAVLIDADAPRDERTLYPPRLDATPRWTLGPHPPGRRFGRFVLLDEIGRGGMGVVYQAFDPERSRPVALKVLLAGEHSAPEHVERFLREASIASRLDHDNVIPVLDSGWAERRAYFTMPLVEGPSLDELCARARDGGAPVPTAEAIRLTIGVARALQAAHGAGLVHRDVKPSNVLLTRDGVPRLGDFGLATDLETSSQLTRSGQLLGTPAYMAPELLSADGVASPATDQYGLGAVLYELLAGEPPYAGSDAISVVRRVVDGPPPSVLTKRADVPPALAVVLAKAMARDPADRYPDVGVLAEDLQRVALGRPTIARPPGPLARAWAWARRHRRPAAGVAVVAAAMGLAVEAATVAHELVLQRAVAEREHDAALQSRQVQRHVAGLVDEGEVEEAAAALHAFAVAPPYRGTAPATAALLERARLLDDARQPAAVEAWAAAYASAARPAEQDPALRGLAAHFARAWRWDPLAHVVASLLLRNPSATRERDVVQWRAQALLGTHALRQAALEARDAELPDAPLLAALAQVRRVRGFDGEVAPGPDGTVWGWAPGSARIRSVAADGTERWQLVLASPVQELVPVAPDGRMLVVRTVTGDISLLEPAGDGLRTAVHWQGAQVLSAVRGDADGDGQAEVWIGLGPYDRRLVRARRSDHGWVLDRPAHAVDAAVSDVGGVVVTDLDGDGATELTVAAGAWRAYDVRWLDPGLALGGRIKLGQVHDVVVDRRDPRTVWVAKEDRNPSRLMFPPTPRSAVRPGCTACSERATASSWRATSRRRWPVARRPASAGPGSSTSTETAPTRSCSRPATPSAPAWSSTRGATGPPGWCRASCRRPSSTPTATATTSSWCGWTTAPRGCSARATTPCPCRRLRRTRSPCPSRRGPPPWPACGAAPKSSWAWAWTPLRWTS